MYIPYVVQPGDSLYFIARMFGTTVEAIMAANRLTNPAMIYVGQVLYIPVGQPTQPPVQPPGTFPYVVQPGDTLYFIAQRFNTTVETLMKLNNITNPDLIFPGQVIFVPVVTPTTMPPTTMPPTTMPPTTMPPTTMPPTTMPPTTMPPVCGTGTFPYTVQVGDTLFFIAQRFGVTVEAILAANPQIVDPSLIFPGQVICIPQMPPTTMPPTTIPPTTIPPTTTPPGTCPAGSFAYIVRRGDTLYKIARRFNTSVDAIIALNPNVNPDNLQIGQVLCIPSFPGCPVGSFAYTIRPGDTLLMLAQRFGTTVEAILALNPGLNPQNLIVGSIVCIPEMNPPAPGTCPANSFAYQIKQGDTLYTIARRFNTSVDAIIALNPGINPDNLQVGSLICVPVAQACPTGSFAYTIRSGDTLYNIARRFGTTVEAILALNPGLDPLNLQVGAIICIPGIVPTTMPPTTMPPTTRPPVTCPPNSFAYTIQAGDTFFLLAQRFGTTTAAIAALNPGVDPSNLQIGQVICIPSAKVCLEFTFAYTIKPGDTLFSIAQRYGTTVQALLTLNPEVDPNNLQVGQVICVPEPTTLPPTTMPPTTQPPVTCPAGSFSYTVKAGDTLYLLSQRFDVPSESIVALNPGVNWSNLQIGQVLCIPNPVTCPAGSYPAGYDSSYTLAQFAALYNTTVEAILAVNPGLDPNNLKNGQIICIPQTTPTTMPPGTCPPGSFPIILQPGDTLAQLAQRIGSTVAELLRLNPGLDPNNVPPGTTICIPTPQPPTTPPPVTCPVGSFSYTIQAGDTFYLLAQRFGTSVESIQALNPTVNPANLQIGQVICIPNPVQCPVGSFPYQIKSGDTLYNLARQFGTTVEAIQALNPTINPNNLMIGQTICIPKATPTTIPPTTVPPTTTPPPTCPTGSFAYRIKAGDTFYLLSQRFQTTVAAIQALNPTVNPNNLQIGQIICIPNAEGSLPPGVCPEGSFAYTIQAGDTYYTLAQRFGTTVEAIDMLNPNVDPDNLIVGSKICIPGTARSEGDDAGDMVAKVEESAQEATRACPTGSFAYTIQAGDTFFTLAEKYNTTVEAIQQLNPTVNPSNLQIGQVICIPQAAPTTMPPTTVPPVACPTGSFAYTIKAGDNFYALAIRFGTTAEAIQALNPHANPYDLKVGQVICIPQAAPTTVPPTTNPPGTCQAGSFAYTVRAGDTYFILARRFGTTVEAIQAANPSVDPNNLKIGQVICIPGVPGTTVPPTTQPPSTFRYVVQVGDTLFFIARRFGTTVDAILKLNPQITDPSALFPGQVILIPQPARS